MKIEDVYQLITDRVIQGMTAVNWSKAVADIERVKGMVSFKGEYLTESGEQKSLESPFGFFDAQAIHELHTITTENGKSRWNKLKFTLFPTGKFELNFIWDQEYQDKIDKANEEERRKLK